MLWSGSARAQQNIPDVARSNLSPPTISAKSWVLMDQHSGWVLASSNPDLAIEPDDGTVFLGIESQPLHVDHLSRLVRDYVLAAGVTHEGACHLFRHTAATLMLENGADIRYIQELLGHSDLETTEIYTHVTIDKLQAVHRLSHPGALLRRRTQDTAATDDELLLEELYRSFAEEAAEEEDV